MFKLAKGTSFCGQPGLCQVHGLASGAWAVFQSSLFNPAGHLCAVNNFYIHAQQTWCPSPCGGRRQEGRARLDWPEPSCLRVKACRSWMSPSPPVSLVGWMLGRSCQLECWDLAVAEREDSGAGTAFLHPAPLCTWSLCNAHLSCLYSTSPTSSPATTSLPTLKPRNTHLLVFWTRQAISPLWSCHMLCHPPRVPSLSSLPAQC